MDNRHFSTFEFDPSVPELRRRGRPVHLQEMPLRVLEVLLEQPGQLVHRETFFSRLWPNDDSGILDDNLNTAVRKLRLALDDSAHHPQFVETVPKRGYRFISPVTGSEDTPSPHENQLFQAAKSAHGRTLPARVLLLAGLILAITVSAFYMNDSVRKAPSEAQAQTLVVLPFINAGGDPADEYFSDGLAEELMDRLSHPEGLRVVSRTSAFALKGLDIDAREIGRLLGVDALVEGSVRRDEDRLRVSVRLVDAGSGYQLWSETYERHMHDVFAIQEDISITIARALQGHLSGAVENQVLARPITDPVAYDLYLQGRFHWHRRTGEGLRMAADYFEQAVERAPDYVPGWVGLGDAYAVLGFYDYLAPADAFPRAQDSAQQALELDPDNAAALATLGYVALYYDWNLDLAESRFRQAIAANPSYSKAHQWYANLLTADGRFDEAEREMRRAQELDPLSLIANAALGWVRYHAGQHEAALTQFRLTLDLDPDFELAYLWSGWALEALDRHDEALPMLRNAVTRSDGSGISIASLARLHALRGERADAEQLLQTLIDSNAYVPSYEIAKAWLALGQTDQAMEWLHQAVEERSHSIVFLDVDPQLATLREDGDFRHLRMQIWPGTDSDAP
jgi:TolB-like protein/DNA-binding winged helix-turn-helix (wHTH) protein/Flp pilus assembly protein TadD